VIIRKRIRLLFISPARNYRQEIKEQNDFIEISKNLTINVDLKILLDHENNYIRHSIILNIQTSR